MTDTKLSSGARIHAVNQGKRVAVPDLTFELVVIHGDKETTLMTATSPAEIMSVRKGFGITKEQALELIAGKRVAIKDGTVVLRKK